MAAAEVTPSVDPARNSALCAAAELPLAHELQEIVELAAEICGVPISLVSLMDSEKQRIKAAVGTHLREVRRELTFCAYTIDQNEMFVIEDTMRDIRFAGHPMVTGDPEIRFYAGLPLRGSGSEAIGTLCVVDTVPRRLTRTQERCLGVLVTQLKTTMDLRARTAELEQAMAARDQATAKLHASERQFRLFMDSSPLVSFIKDEGGKFLFYNARMRERFGVEGDAWLGKSVDELFPAKQADLYREHDSHVLRTGEPLESLETTLTSAGAEVTWKTYKFVCEDESGHRHLGGVAMDVTHELELEAEQAKAQELLHAMSTIDPLTQMPNRRVFDECLQPEFEKAQRLRRPLSLMIIDLDNFKRRNERFGFEEGDTALRRVGEILRTSMAEGDLGVRFGGAEFAMLLPETTADEAKALGERIQAKLRESDWGMLTVTASIGVANTRHATRNGRQLLCFAENAIYSAKNAGKNRIVLYTPR